MKPPGPAAAAAAKLLQLSPTVQPHRRQPTRLHRSWDSPGKNTGVCYHFLLQCMKVKSESEVAQSCPTLCDPHGLQPTRLLCPWDFPGKSTGVGCHCLLRIWSWAFVFWEIFFLITASITVLLIGLFIISISTWFSLGRLNFSKTLNI